jgi:hypothetical protein
MEDPRELQARLDRAQAGIEKGVGHITRQKALIAHRLDEGEGVTQYRELLATLEETQRLHVEHRNLLRRELNDALARKNRPQD